MEENPVPEATVLLHSTTAYAHGVYEHGPLRQFGYIAEGAPQYLRVRPDLLATDDARRIRFEEELHSFSPTYRGLKPCGQCGAAAPFSDR